jgi:hypothetical protein
MSLTVQFVRYLTKYVRYLTNVSSALVRRVCDPDMATPRTGLADRADPARPVVGDRRALPGGDIVIQALTSYRIATVAGIRTWGGVISCYCNELVDGTLVTQPTSALWFAGVGWRRRDMPRSRTGDRNIMPGQRRGG